jgi:hypothetical protein
MNNNLQPNLPTTLVAYSSELFEGESESYSSLYCPHQALCWGAANLYFWMDESQTPLAKLKDFPDVLFQSRMWLDSNLVCSPLHVPCGGVWGLQPHRWRGTLNSLPRWFQAVTQHPFLPEVWLALQGEAAWPSLPGYYPQEDSWSHL